MVEAADGGGTAGLVLAAGRSTRMGAPKPLLEVDGRSFLAAAVDALRAGGCDPVLAVVSSTGEVAAEAERAGAVVVEGRPDGEQIDSLRGGLDALTDALTDARTTARPDGAAAVLVLPVDHPLVRPATVRALLDAAARSPGAVVRPVHDGEPGHPTLFPRSRWPALRDPDLPDGARSVVEGAHSGGVDATVVDVAVDDPGVVADIDTPAAYRRHVGGEPRVTGEPGAGEAP